MVLWHVVTPVKPAVLWPAGQFWQSVPAVGENMFSGQAGGRDAQCSRGGPSAVSAHGKTGAQKMGN